MAGKPRTTQLIFPIAALIVAVLLVSAAAIVRQRGNEQRLEEKRPDSISAAPVRLVTVERRRIPVVARFHGFLQEYLELTTSSRVPGEITEQWVDVADEVTKGQVLFKIDDETRKFELERALAAQIRSQNEFALAKANWERVRALPDLTSTSLENIEAHREFLSAEASANEADAAARHAELMLERTVVRSPMDGRISRVYQRKGEFAQFGQPLIDVIEIDRLKLMAEVADHEVVWIRAGDDVTLVTDIFPGESFAGTVHYVHPLALPSSRKFQIEIEFFNADRRLRPGFFVRGEIAKSAATVAFGEPAEVSIVPREAVTEMFGQHFCYRIEQGVDEDAGRILAVRTLVTVWPVPSDPRVMRVESGLAPGDRVVTKGIKHLSDRTRVRVVE